MTQKFILHSDFKPAGDQPQAIKKLCAGLDDGLHCQTLLGVTGSGKTFTMANIIAQTQRPALILAPNKTLAAQLYAELKELFPKNAVEYFVSYYDYYQPEAYIPTTDTFIEKDASINAHIEQMRLSATKAILQRSDTLIVASVSAIYGLGDPKSYLSMVLHLSCGESIDQSTILHHLARMQYARNDTELKRSTYRVRGECIDVFPADSEEHAIRIELFDQEIESIKFFDPLTGVTTHTTPRVTLFPKSHYVMPREKLLDAVECIKEELKIHLAYLHENQHLLEYQRLKERVQFDIEMILQLGYCSGIENYSRYLSGREAGQPPPTLLDYLPDDAIVIVDESHVTIPQIGAMFKGDRSRKEKLVRFGFRLPSALDNRPLKFDEFESIVPQMICVSATPAHYEQNNSGATAELVIRPTGLLDPVIEVRPVATQVDDVLSEANKRSIKNERVLVTTLTKRMSEDLTDYLREHGVKVRYLHSDIDTLERVEIIKDLRLGVFDVLVGINLLREGLDIPEVSMVAILDADKQGFLRSERSLIQTIGRAARNIEGRAILYGNTITKAMQFAIDETKRRRKIQHAHNKKHNITPQGIIKKVSLCLQTKTATQENKTNTSDNELSLPELTKKIASLDKLMYQQARDLEFEKASKTRDELQELKNIFILSGRAQ